MSAVSEAGRENSSCWALVVKGEGVEEGGEIRGVKRRVRLRVGAEGWGVLAVPSERRRGMLDGHIQSREREKGKTTS